MMMMMVLVLISKLLARLNEHYELLHKNEQQAQSSSWLAH